MPLVKLVQRSNSTVVTSRRSSVRSPMRWLSCCGVFPQDPLMLPPTPLMRLPHGGQRLVMMLQPPMQHLCFRSTPRNQAWRHRGRLLISTSLPAASLRRPSSMSMPQSNLALLITTTRSRGLSTPRPLTTQRKAHGIHSKVSGSSSGAALLPIAVAARHLPTMMPQQAPPCRQPRPRRLSGTCTLASSAASDRRRGRSAKSERAVSY
mmetsp:Transcript_40883/g.102683  ORF Transcript_40883/g.102683 Transcript_40883/m.102683 type:complete len:207 (-) Transcript_40883:801-1421(-)